MKKCVKLKQQDITDCGPACLTSIAAYYGLKIPISKIRQFAGTDQRGTNVAGLIEAAMRLGFQCKAAKGIVESLTKIPLPAIAHMLVKQELQHYVVIL